MRLPVWFTSKPTAGALSCIDLTLANAAVLIGALLQGSVGFGLGFIGSPLLMLIHPEFIPGPLLLNAVVLTLLFTHRERRSIVFADLKWALVGRAVGVLCAAPLLVVVSAERMGLVLGVLVLALVAMSASGVHVPPNRTNLITAGSISGFAGTTVSIGGPPMGLVYQHAMGPRVRGNLSAYFVVGTAMSLTALYAVGRFGSEEALAALGLAPGLVVGFVLSRRVAALLDRGYTRAAILVTSALAALVLILRKVV